MALWGKWIVSFIVENDNLERECDSFIQAFCISDRQDLQTETGKTPRDADTICDSKRIMI